MRLGFGHIPVSGGHQIYYETYGNPNGKPAVAVHGGPGGGSNPRMTKIYNLKKWYVVLIDQRGCGKSLPYLEVRNNTTQDLIDDMEIVRELLQIRKWFVSGGSWGTTLALLYAQAHPDRVTGLLLRGVCLGNEQTNRWLYQKGGVSEIYPEGWKLFTSVLPKRLHDKGWRDIATFYHTHLKGPHAMRFARAWWGWEASVSTLVPHKDTTSDKQALGLALIENHYFVNNCFIKEGQILEHARRLRKIPITIVHGRYDVVCPITQAFDIKRVLPHTKLCIVTKAGHASFQPNIRSELYRATSRACSSTKKQIRK